MLTLKTENWRMPVGIGYDPSPAAPERLAGLIAPHPANANGQLFQLRIFQRRLAARTATGENRRFRPVMVICRRHTLFIGVVRRGSIT
jgi:hypothetical protein